VRIIDKEGNTVLHIEDAAALYAAVARGRKVLFNLLDAIPYAALDEYVKHRYGIDMERENSEPMKPEVA
jgi:hypothetical protein